MLQHQIADALQKGSKNRPLEAYDIASDPLGLWQRLGGFVIQQLGAGHIPVVQ